MLRGEGKITLTWVSARIGKKIKAMGLFVPHDPMNSSELAE